MLMRSRRLLLSLLPRAAAAAFGMRVALPEAHAAQAGDDDIDEETLTALVDTVIPEDHDPGAVAAGVVPRILEELTARPQIAQVYRDGLRDVDAAAVRAAGRPFVELDPATRTALFENLLAGSATEPLSLRHFAVRVRSTTLTLFYTSAVGQRMLDYRPPLAGYVDDGSVV